MRVECKTQEVPCTSDGDHDDCGGGVEVVCGACNHLTYSCGTSDRSVRRCLVLMREECPRSQKNFYDQAPEIFDAVVAEVKGIKGGWEFTLRFQMEMGLWVNRPYRCSFSDLSRLIDLLKAVGRPVPKQAMNFDPNSLVGSELKLCATPGGRIIRLISPKFLDL